MFFFVLPIVIIGMVFSHKQKMAKSNALSNSGSDQIKALQAELKSVKERLNTLEAIVTDDKYQLNQELSKLKSAN
jgi:vacuolar-type H+-ATPase subunit I/STV1